MTNTNKPTRAKQYLVCRQIKWKTIERIAYLTAFVLLIVYSALSTVSKFTNFNSAAFFVLVIILSVIMAADVVVWFISRYRLYRINRWIAGRESNDIDNDNDMREENYNGSEQKLSDHYPRAFLPIKRQLKNFSFLISYRMRHSAAPLIFGEHCFKHNGNRRRRFI